MRLPQLILQHRQQIRNNAHSLLQQTHPLIHLQIRPHSLVYRLQLRLGPHQFRCIEHRPLQVDVNAQNKELADLHVDLAAGQIDAARAGDGAGNGLGGRYGAVEEVFVEGGLSQHH